MGINSEDPEVSAKAEILSVYHSMYGEYLDIAENVLKIMQVKKRELGHISSFNDGEVWWKIGKLNDSADQKMKQKIENDLKKKITSKINGLDAGSHSDSDSHGLLRDFQTLVAFKYAERQEKTKGKFTVLKMVNILIVSKDLKG